MLGTFVGFGGRAPAAGDNVDDDDDADDDADGDAAADISFMPFFFGCRRIV